jgi:7,8-dihydroneopterin aldolase/epimerase/oxygenase
VTLGGDRISLRGLRAHGRHGVFDEERAMGQTFVVDVALELDTRPAAESDELADTVDYGVLASDVVGIVEGEPVRLLETLAARLAERCLGHVGVTAVEVTVHKPEAPMGVAFEDVTVTIRRSRP